VTRSWSTAGANDDPIDTLGTLIPAHDIDAAFDEFAARNALWDYPAHDRIVGWVQTYAATYPTYHEQVSIILSAGTGGLVDPAPGRALHELGTHQFVLSPPADHVIDLQIEGEAQGTFGTPATWSATLVRQSPNDGILYTPVTFTGGSGAMTVTLPDDEHSARLVVTVHGEGRQSDETFPYRLRVGAAPAEVDAGPGVDAGDPGEETPDTGCCSTGGGGGGSVLLALFVISASRARSRRR
jgi:hypothetical protein